MQKCLNDAKINDEGRLMAAGIDAPLYWARNGKRRKSDSYVYDIYVSSLPSNTVESSNTSGTVQAVNSLRGACLIQGFFLAKKIKAKYPNCVITETHPKVLMAVSNEAEQFVKGVRNQHERDALISAWAAVQCLREKKRSISCKKWNIFYLDNKKDVHTFLKNTIYWWPK